MANVALAYGSQNSLTVTNLHSLANSATTVWRSAAVDNTSDLWEDAQVVVTLAFSGTAPGNSRCAYVYAYSGDGSDYARPANGSEGTTTIPDVTTNANALRLLGVVPYNTTGETVRTCAFSVAAAFGGSLPPKWGVCIVNHSGAALASSGSSVVWRGVRRTVS